MKTKFTKLIALFLCVHIIGGLFPVFADTANTTSIRILLCDAGENLNVHTSLQTAFIDGPYENVALYANGTQELSQPAPITLTWQIIRKSNVSLPSKYYIKITENPDMSGGNNYSTANTHATIYNCKPGTRYYWQVSATVDGNTYTSEPSSFSTNNRLPYNLLIGGVTNVRDIGGYTTSDGGKVKFGMVYRTAKLNENEATTPLINAQGIATMRNELHIRSEIDLRGVNSNEYGGRSTSTLGSDVNYYLCPLGYNGNVLELSNYASIRKIFNYLGNENNYPLIFHCAIGTDRTGLIAYLIDGLLGVSENDLMKDYLFSNFGNIGGSRQPSFIRKAYPMVIKKYYGSTLSEKIYNYLNIEVGVSTTTLDNIISILKEFPQQSGYTEIYSADQLKTMDPDGNYILTNDLLVDYTYTRKFTGSIDGNGHIIRTNVPLFSNFCGSIKDLTIDGEIFSSSNNAAALTITTSGMKAENVTNNANVTLAENYGDYSAGGFVAKVNNGEVYFISCHNNGNITAFGEAGGFIGLCSGELSMTDCVNNGEVTVAKEANCGGIVAETAGGFHMEKCFNFGNVTGNGAYCAGIAARVYENEGFANLKTISSVGNYGNVMGSGEYVSGIFGLIAASAGSLTYSYNLGNINGGANTLFSAGLIANFNNTTFNISKCFNAGQIMACDSANTSCIQLFHNESNSVDTDYLYFNYALSDINVPAFCYKNSYGQLINQNATSNNATAIPFSLDEMLNGSLCETLNSPIPVYFQNCNHPSMTDIIYDGFCMRGVHRIYGVLYSFDENGNYIGLTDSSYTGLYTENGNIYYVENGMLSHGWKTVNEKTYYFDPFSGAALIGRHTIDDSNYVFDDNGILVSDTSDFNKGIYFDNYILTIENASDIEFIRIAKGILNTSANIKNAPDCINIGEDIIVANTDSNGIFRYELPDGGIYSIWYRYDDKTTGIAAGIDGTFFTQTVFADGLKTTIYNLYGVKDFYISKGKFSTYREIKNSGNYFSATSAKFDNLHNYVYTAPTPGEYTLLVRYNDSTRADEILYFTCAVTYPTIETDGRQIEIGNLNGVKVIRIAPGTYYTMNEIKSADGAIGYSASSIVNKSNEDGKFVLRKNADEDGTSYTAAIVYDNLYQEIHRFTLRKKIPAYIVNGNSITFSNLDGLYIVRYVSGNYSTCEKIKTAPGNLFIKNHENDSITLNNLYGNYTFMVQYYEESQSFYTIDFPE